MTIEKHRTAPESVIPCAGGPTSGEEFAWKVHGALQDWTAKVDTKASIVMTLETALLSGMVAFNSSRASGYSFSWASLHNCGLTLLFVAVALAGAVVFPQLHRRDSAKPWQDQFIYFGHLRKWEPAALAEALVNRGSNGSLSMLSDQLVSMSRIVWIKHVLVQWSLLLAFMGCLAVGIPLVAVS